MNLQRRRAVFEKLNQIAEHAAANASRREFMGRLGRGAMAAAATVAGILAFVDEAEAGGQTVACCGGTARCRQPAANCRLLSSCWRHQGSRSKYCLWICNGRRRTTYCGSPR
jgi:hypothetical protein